MKHRVFLMGAALAALTPSIAYAQCGRDGSGRVVGTVAGAGVGALGGAVIAGKGDDAEGAIIGGIIGAIAGNQISKSDSNCKRAYGWYDKDGRWHATGVSSADARGYYDRDGKWVDGRPGGYYDNGRWVSMSEADGYWDRSGNYIPTNTYSYYDSEGRMQSGYANGYYDSRGRWVAGAVRGRYDSRGRWIAGDPGYSASSSWSSVEQPGYWQNGRWVSGTTTGYYDSRGRWISNNSNGDRWSNNDRNDDRTTWNNQPTDISERISWMRQRVQRMESRDRLGNNDERMALNELDRIEAQYDVFKRSGNRLTNREQTTVERSLDRLQQRVMTARQEARRN